MAFLKSLKLLNNTISELQGFSQILLRERVCTTQYQPVSGYEVCIGKSVTREYWLASLSKPSCPRKVFFYLHPIIIKDIPGHAHRMTAYIRHSK